MNTSTKILAVFLVPLACLTGCSTAPYKPAGLTQQQYSQKMNDLRETCRKFRQGDYVTITYYQGAPGATASTVSGYFYAYNKMSETISLASKYMEYSDRGEPYKLDYLSQITPTQDPIARVYQPNFIVKAITNFFTIKDHDNEKAVLTQ